MIAFYGMGLLGSNFVRALSRRGEAVQVWNRSEAKARALEVLPGVTACSDPEEAARGATRLHLTLSDDAAVDEVLARARPAIAQRAVIVDHSTTTAQGAAERARIWAERGAPYLHAPVFMGPQNAHDATGLMLASGPRALFDSVSGELAKMTGKLHFMGESPDSAAAFKLMGNLFLMFLTEGLADMLALGKAMGVEPAQAATLFEMFNPGNSIPARIKRMTDASFSAPSWTLEMARKDARLMIDEAGRGGVTLPALPAIAAHMDALIARGHGADDWTVIASDFVK